MITLQQYQKESKRTSASLGNDKLDLAHMVLGIFSEYNELFSAISNLDDVNISEELADMNWYLANYCTFRDIGFATLYSGSIESTNTLRVNISLLQDIVKKYIAYNTPINRDNEYLVLKAIAHNLNTLYKMYSSIDLLQSLENNINKLKIRFPDKFTEENAVNRNLEEERKALEKN